jgi:CheY-like chemotaxis protein
MSHEIRTPLNGIIGFAEIVKDSRDMAEAKENTSVIISESEKLLILINQLLDLSRIEAGGLHLDRTAFSLSEVVESINNMFKPMVENKGIEFSILFDDPHPSTLIGDAFRIRQILINLLGNAVKFTQKGKVELRISCNYQSTRKKGYLFVVEDTGKGIAMDKLDNIFDSFVQEDTSITREYGGSGLGTAISKSFVELMDGRIGVESVEGEGTSFWFQVDFPLSKESLNVKSNITREDILELFTGSRILLAEDYLANQEVIKRYLRDTGTELVIAADGSEACNILDKQKFDLILLDIHMPNKNGYEVAQYIRKQLNSPMVIVGLTADGYQQVQERCKEVGMDDFLTKPIRKHTLLDTLGKWLRPQT